MANRLELPEELNSLIEKREEGDRRKADTPDQGEAPIDVERRSGADRRHPSPEE